MTGKEKGALVHQLDWYHEFINTLNIIHDDQSLKAALEKLLGDILDILGASKGSVRIWPGEEKHSVSAEAGMEGFGFCFEGLAAPDCVCGKAIKSGGWTTSATPGGSQCFVDGVETLFCAPLFSGGRPSGVFAAGFENGQHQPSQEAVRLALMALSSLGQAVENMAAKLRDINMARDMETVNYIGGLIAGKLTLKEMTREIVSRLGAVLETDEVNVIVYNGERQELSFLASYFAEGSEREGPDVYPLSDGINSWIIKHRKPLLMTHDTVTECARLGIRHGGRPAKSWLGAPMIFQGKVVGVVSVQSYKKKGLYDQDSVSLLKAVANQCAVAVVNARLFEEITEREAEKERLYFSLTHDLLSMVNPIAGFAKIMKATSGGPMGETRDMAVESILLATGKITRFAEDILVSDKLKSGKLALDISRRNMAEPLKQAIALHVPELMARSIGLSVNGAFVEPSLDGVEKITSIVDIQADLDPAQMERVFINLVSNAIKHARSRIDINMAAAGPEVEVVFRDDGDGAPKEECPHLFEEYYQAHKGKRGVGLGLPSVKKIIEMHDGQIGIDSDTGAGFTVFMKWPRTLADRKDDDAPKEGAM